MSYALHVVHVPQKWKSLEATMEEWHPAHTTTEEPQSEFSMKEGKENLLVRSLLSVFFVFFKIEAVVEVGWCGVESHVEFRSVISVFTHSFYGLLT